MNNAVQEIRQRIFALQDEEYAAFQRKLIPSVDPATIVGVRIPALRMLAREVAKTPLARPFMEALPHEYYEENTLHGLLIERMASYADAVASLDAFLPYVDNWATCDVISPKAFKKHPDELPGQAHRWMSSQHAYTVRFGIGALLSFCLDEQFSPEHLAWVAAVESEEYYVNMMRAWYFATALAKQWSVTVPYIEQRKLDPWTHAKAIQKAKESRRLTPKQKEYLKTLK